MAKAQKEKARKVIAFSVTEEWKEGLDWTYWNSRGLSVRW